MSNIKILFLTKYGRLGASSRLRTLQFVDYFSRNNIDCVVSELIVDRILSNKYVSGRYKCKDILCSYARRVFALLNRNKYDALWIEKEALPWVPFFVEEILLKEIPYILDYDDAIFHHYDEHRFRVVRYFYGSRLDNLMAGASLVTVGNNYLSARAQSAGSRWIEYVPTVVDLSRYPLKPSFPKSGPVPIIVWIGSPSTTRYLEILRQPLKKLSENYMFKFRVIGADNFELENVDVESLPWAENTEVTLLNGCDIGVMPLHNSNWELGKCGYKLIQYMASYLPVVASPVGVNSDIVSHGKNGFLAESGEDWFDFLSILLDNLELRTQLGLNGRMLVESRYSLQRQAPRLEQMLQKVASKRRNRTGIHHEQRTRG
jgi:glycosyltransferase involved in cell wall biosynthesis